ncbi:MAG TPA: hypothetical protein ENJ75_01210 [Candidatus Kaiserbacteria bacterium]|nr:hypothetical protein [Candidatus Kaiserbacteria bacterium]
MEKLFHIGDVLSVTTGYIVSSRQLDGISDIVKFMTGDNSLCRHQVPRASEECKPYLLEQYPQLRGVDASGVTSENWQKWIDEQVARFGEKLSVRPIPEERHKFRNPLDELQKLMGADKVIPISVY